MHLRLRRAVQHCLVQLQSSTYLPFTQIWKRWKSGCGSLDDYGWNMLNSPLEHAGWWYSCRTILMLTGGQMMGNSANSRDGQITRECMQMWVAAVRHNLSESVWHIHPLICTPVHHITTQQCWRHMGDTGLCFLMHRSCFSGWSKWSLHIRNTGLHFLGPCFTDKRIIGYFNGFVGDKADFPSKRPHLGTRFKRITV